MLRLRTFIIKTLTTNVAPMVYIMMFVSAFIGFCFATGLLLGPAQSILYTTAILLDKQLWGVLVCLGSLIAEWGFYKRNRGVVMVGSFIAFCLWLFAGIGLFLAGHYYVFITLALFQLLFQGYVYLSASLDVLERESIN